MGIYQWRNTVNNHIYVGSSKDLKRRESAHRYCLERGFHHSRYLQRSWVKHGAAAFVFEVIESITDEDMIKSREQHYLDMLKPEYNICEIAGRPPLNPDMSYRNTPEYRQKMSAWVRGPEYRQKMSEALRGRTISKQHREKLSESLKGKKKSIAHRASLSRALKGNKNGFTISSQNDKIELSNEGGGNICKLERSLFFSSSLCLFHLLLLVKVVGYVQKVQTALNGVMILFEWNVRNL